MKNMRIIGITGGIGSGKTSILQYIQEHYYGVRIFLADEVAMELQKKGAVCYDALVDLLGGEILLPDGEIDRRKMAEKVFGNEALLSQVNSIVHPAVRQFFLQQFAQARQDGVELLFVEAALLIECGYKAIVDEMWVVFASRAAREQRLTESRGYTREKIQSIMEHQLSEREFLEAADFVIDNSYTPEEAFVQIRQKLEAYTWHK